MSIAALFPNCAKVSGFIALVGFIFTGSFGQDAPKSANPPDSSKENASTVPFANDVSEISDIRNTEIRGRVDMLTAVKLDELAITPVYNALGLLQGRVPGVNISPGSGAPGRETSVSIRGIGTVNNSDPLYVVDGIPVESIDFLNPNDIESISILKDASAAAIYGPGNANGVVLVTTKIAREGTSLVSYDFSIGTQRPWRKPSLCNAEQWAILNNEARRAANLPIYSEFENPAILGEGTDWWDEVTSSNTLIQSHNVSVTRGTKKLRYFLSAGYFYQDGTIKGSGLRKAMFRFNARKKIAGWISVGNNLGFAHTRTNHINETDEWNSLLINTLSMARSQRLATVGAI